MNALNERQKKLKELIENNQTPIVHNCTWDSNLSVFTLGDLQQIGWMDKRYTHDFDGEIDGWIRTYFGPNPFKLYTCGAKELEIINPNDTIE